MAYFQWTDKLSLGNPFIDADHQRIIALINDLHDAMSERAGEAIIRKVLFDLIVYCQGHFMREEEQMKVICYPGYEAHKREHDALVEKVRGLYGESEESTSPTLTIQTAHFLRDWLTTHILKSDMALAAVLRKAA